MTVVPIRQIFLTKGRGGRPGKLIAPKALVIHWTGNPDKGANAKRNRDYFENHPKAKVSAHYVVDDTEIVQCIPEDEMAYHVGSKRGYMPGVIERLSRNPNDCTIGIEICVNQDGNFSRALRNAVELAADICRRYGWGKDRLWRHYDITGKNCPAFFVNDKTAWAYGFGSAHQAWERFKADVEIELLRFREKESTSAQPAGEVGQTEEVVDEVTPTKVVYRGKELDGFIKDGRTFVEVRKLCEAFGKQVIWNAEKRIVEVRDSA